MVDALMALKASLASKYGENSVFTPNDMPAKGVVSTGSLSMDYMTGRMGIPRDCVVEFAGEPGCGKSTTSLSIINNVLNLELSRSRMSVLAERAAKSGKISQDDLKRFNRAYDRQEFDLHVFDDPKKNRMLDSDLSQRDEDEAFDRCRNALYVDLEGRFDPKWASRFIDSRFLNSKFLLVRNDTIEQATDAYTECVRTGKFAVAVIDSIGGAPSKGVFDKSAERGNVGGNALGVTRFSQFAENHASRYTCLTIGLNQVRADMEGWNRLITPGGKAWKHACSLRIELKRRPNNPNENYWAHEGRDGSFQCGYMVHARLHKNSVGRSGQACEFDFFTADTPEYGPAGFSPYTECINLAVMAGLIEKGGGGWMKYPSFPNGRIQGIPRAVEYLRDHSDVFQSLRDEVRSRLTSGGIEGAVTSFDYVPEGDSDE